MASDRSVLERQIERVELRPFTLEGFHRRRQRKDRNRRIGSAVVALVVVGGTIGGLLRAFSSGTVPANDPRRPFLGTWVSTDADGSHQTMVIRPSGDGVEIEGHDDSASVCSGAPSTMTGTGQVQRNTELIVPSPTFTCDDGSEPTALSGPPLREQLRNLTFVDHPETDTITDTFGVVWKREGAEDPNPTPKASGGMWPQSSLEQVREAQDAADAGDPAYTWQVDAQLDRHIWPSDDTEIVGRFLREELGWEEFRYWYIGEDTFDSSSVKNNAFIRCAPGETNPVYPNDGCAPTIDDTHYERVVLDLEQLVREDATGIWVVTRWDMIEPFEQVAPPSEAETTALLEAFLQARIDGEGAEGYVDTLALDGDEIPFLYATPTGAPYERSEFEVAEGPLWPDGRMRFKVRLFAEDGQTVVEQFFRMDRPEWGLWYEEQTGGPDGSEGPGTTVNGRAVPVPYSVFDGEVTLHMTYPWRAEPLDDPNDQGSRFNLLNDEFEGALQLLGSGPVRNGCQQGPAPADAQALALRIRSNPDLEATAPVAVSVGGIPALQMDVTTALNICPSDAPPKVAEVALHSQLRIRLYLLDLPQGSSARILAIAIIAGKESFERAMESAAPIVHSIEFHTR
jgi:hypothetical protein